MVSTNLKSSNARRLRLRVIAMLAICLMAAGLYFRAEIQRHTSRLLLRATGRGSEAGGTLLIAGGGNLPERVQRQFVELAGGSEAKIVMIPGVHVDDTYVHSYFEEWNNFGPASVHILNAETRAEADSDEFVKPLEDATGVWFGGGQQTWLTSCYLGTKTEAMVRKVLERQGVVGGTSAGAAVMSEIMITGGRKQPTIGTGFGFLPGVIIDQHFLKRNRFSRLRQVVESNPKLVGIGIDENTALLVSLSSRRVRVLGESYIMVCLPEKFGKSYRVDVDFYNPGDEFELSEPGHPEAMLARSSYVESWLDE